MTSVTGHGAVICHVFRIVGAFSNLAQNSQCSRRSTQIGTAVEALNWVTALTRAG